jgi:hypothetical protein
LVTRFLSSYDAISVLLLRHTVSQPLDADTLDLSEISRISWNA